MHLDADPLTGTHAAVWQRLAELFHEIDARLGRDIVDFYVEDGVLAVGGVEHSGHEAIVAFYAARAKRILAELKDGERTARHLVLNLRLTPAEAGDVDASFVMLYFAGEGRPPLLGTIAPSAIADCRMRMRRGPDHAWRVSRFDSTPLFIGDDPFLRKAFDNAST